VTESPIYDLTPYLGKTVQFPLDKAIVAKKGRIVALNVPSWAPALQIGQTGATSWRGSRQPDKCGISTPTQDLSYQLFLDGATRLGKIGNFSCLYKQTRVTFSVTMITDPSPAPKTVSSTTTVAPVTSRR